MSRSRRAPYWTDGYGSKRKKLSKRSASRAIRDLDEASAPRDGAGYKRFYPSWDICDYKFYDDGKPLWGHPPAFPPWKVRRK